MERNLYKCLMSAICCHLPPDCHLSHRAPYPGCCLSDTHEVAVLDSSGQSYKTAAPSYQSNIPESKLMRLDFSESLILEAEMNSILLACILMLITIIILITGTCIVSSCSPGSHEIVYSALPQGDWIPEHLEMDNIMDLLHNIHKKENLKPLGEILMKMTRKSELQD